MSPLALTWFEHRRTSELCAGLGIELAVLATPRRGAVRYALLAARTIALLLRRRPDALLVQNPSLVLAALCVSLRPLLRYRLAVDAHNEAVEPFLNRSRLVAWVTRWVLRRADLTIVTNAPLARVVKGAGGTPFILPDRIPTPPIAAGTELGQGFNAVLIATFAGDEPYKEVLAAAAGLPLTLFVTGNHRKLGPAVLDSAPTNVRFTGFLSEHDYWSLLRSVDAVVDLTTMDNCLVCGAYEALAVHKPLLLSRNEASVSLFGDCALFTDNSVADIRSQLLRLSQSAVRTDTGAACEKMTRDWNAAATGLMRVLKVH